MVTPSPIKGNTYLTSLMNSRNPQTPALPTKQKSNMSEIVDHRNQDNQLFKTSTAVTKHFNNTQTVQTPLDYQSSQLDYSQLNETFKTSSIGEPNRRMKELMSKTHKELLKNKAIHNIDMEKAVQVPLNKISFRNATKAMTKQLDIS